MYTNKGHCIIIINLTKTHLSFGDVKHEIEHTRGISRGSVVGPGVELVVVHHEALFGRRGGSFAALSVLRVTGEVEFAQGVGLHVLLGEMPYSQCAPVVGQLQCTLCLGGPVPPTLVLKGGAEV